MKDLYFGDNLAVLREHIKDESVDLIYLDPPFNSNANYNVLFKSPKGHDSHAQIEAFQDTWHWLEATEHEWQEIQRNHPGHVADMLSAMVDFLGKNDMTAYLVMMTNRLLELRRVLRPTGSLYLHCDPTASHYLKIVLDAVFGVENFRNEITWKRTSAHSDARRFGKNTDILLFYAKSDAATWQTVYVGYSQDYLGRFRCKDDDGRLWMDDNLTAKGLTGGGYTYEYKGVTSLWRVPPATMERLDREKRLHFTSKGGIRLKRYLDESKGMPAQALWDDIPPINSQSKERQGYPTQKPIALLERIIQASSNPGDVVLDPFCGCGTAVMAAQALGRDWIGIDITHLAIGLIERRIRKTYPDCRFQVHGTPRDVEGARDLAQRDKYQFQWWVCALLGANPYQGKKKGADGGVDGLIYFQDAKDKHQKIVVSVKGGEHVNVAMIRDLAHVIQREKAAMGVFVTLASPTKPMLAEAAALGFYASPHFPEQVYPKLQILTVDGLMTGREAPRYPNLAQGSRALKTASRDSARRDGEQTDLF